MKRFLNLQCRGVLVAIAALAALVACSGGKGSGDEGGNKDACSGADCLDIQDPGDLDVPPDPDRDPGGTDPNTDEGVDTDVDQCTCQSMDKPRGLFCGCEANPDCLNQFCVPFPDGSRKCTTGCVENCPCGLECKQVLIGGEPWSVCLPHVDPLCNQECLNDGECGVDALCAVLQKDLGAVRKYCLQACDDTTNPCPDGYLCQDVRNAADTVTSKQCVPTIGHCDCRPEKNGDVPVDYATDVNHCGSCEHACVYANGVPFCEEGKCSLAGCLEDYINLDQKDDTGCEYHCKYKGPDDRPDPDSVGDACPGENCFDYNCDGLDGNVKKGVFVDSVSGEDLDNPKGDQAHPFKTIAAAIAFASNQETRKEVYVAAGQYHEKVELKDGISIYGGYARETWIRSIAKNKTQIFWDGQETLAVRAVIASNIISETFFDGFFVKSYTATQSSASSYGIFVYHSSNALKIQNCTVEPGKGADGKNGDPGKAGVNSNSGGNGAASYEYDTCGFPIGCNSADYPGDARFGIGGASPCGTTGGNGGRGGSSTGAGLPGSPGADGGGTAGGSGGTKDSGTAGGKGANGLNGLNGSGAIPGGAMNLAGVWEPAHGQDGSDGENGKGGGGGGGGGGDDDCVLFRLCGSAGGSGGGGGGGGCGGTAGKKGTGGGGSFGVFIVEASPVVKNCTITSNDGGNGGNGGAGGIPGLAGLGGSGGSNPESGTGAGGNGGDGGEGGKGGSGGGGSGGPSFRIYIVGGMSSPICDGNTYLKDGFPGVGGQPGESGGVNKGADGASGDVYGATPSCAAPASP